MILAPTAVELAPAVGAQYGLAVGLGLLVGLVLCLVSAWRS
jgi:hypothetical protein